ncbi:hypothetical protein GDO81_011107 [Engystomops pustulosus]|uniref:Uncharacterized protein n=1 Tax=Engystomops pustulosus TaxID=76066 RepID=A0AAV7C5M8_ENGPU|nr:hypothetical protein GDO81_011107 [Engystomops pustulosus]
MEKDGTSIYPYPKCPFFEELLFLLPSRSLRLSGGTPQAGEQPAETPVVQTAPQEFKMEAIPLPIVVDTEKPNGSQELQAGSSRVATPSLDSAEETTSGAALRMTTTPMHSSPATRTAPTRGWGRKSLRATDRQLDVESEAMSLIRRADADDDCDFFGYGIAARCRQMSPGVRNDFMAYVYAAAAAFDSATTLPELGDMINHLRSVTGLKKTPHPPSSSSRLEVASISSQTDPFNLNAP